MTQDARYTLYVAAKVTDTRTRYLPKIMIDLDIPGSSSMLMIVDWELQRTTHAQQSEAYFRAECNALWAEFILTPTPNVQVIRVTCTQQNPTSRGDTL
jgi:hypothetical protein